MKLLIVVDTLRRMFDYVMVNTQDIIPLEDVDKLSSIRKRMETTVYALGIRGIPVDIVHANSPFKGMIQVIEGKFFVTAFVKQCAATIAIPISIDEVGHIIDNMGIGPEGRTDAMFKFVQQDDGVFTLTSSASPTWSRI